MVTLRGVHPLLLKASCLLKGPCHLHCHVRDECRRKPLPTALELLKQSTSDVGVGQTHLGPGTCWNLLRTGCCQCRSTRAWTFEPLCHNQFNHCPIGQSKPNISPKHLPHVGQPLLLPSVTSVQRLPSAAEGATGWGSIFAIQREDLAPLAV